MKWASQLHDGQGLIYLLHGDETFISRHAFEWLRERVLDTGLEDFNLDRFDARDNFDAERIAQAARTLPMMASKRLVVVRNAEVVFTRSKDSVAPLLKYIEDPDPSTCLVFQAMARVKKNGALYKRIQKAGCVVESAPLKLRELRPWILNRTQEHGRRISRDAADYLVEAIGADLAGLDSAIQRLALFVPSPNTIEIGHAEEAIAHTRIRTVWELVDAVANRNPGRALGRAHQLIEQGNAPLQLLALVIRQFRQLLIGCDVRRRGGSVSEAAQKASIPAFRERQFAQQLNHYSWDELTGALERLRRADAQLKSSKLPAAVVFESTILDLCAPSS